MNKYIFCFYCVVFFTGCSGARYYQKSYEAQRNFNKSYHEFSTLIQSLSKESKVKMVSKDGTDCICVYADINDDNARKLMKFIKVPDIFSDTLYTDKKKRYERFGKRLANKINFDILTDNRWEYNVVVFLRANKKEKYFYGQYSAAFEKDGKKEGREAYEMELDEAEFLTNDFQAIH